MAKRADFTALQAHVAKQVGIALHGHEQFMEILREMVRESAEHGRALPTATGVSRRMGIGTIAGVNIMDELVKEKRIVSIPGRYKRLVPNEPEFMGEGK